MTTPEPKWPEQLSLLDALESPGTPYRPAMIEAPPDFPLKAVNDASGPWVPRTFAEAMPFFSDVASDHPRRTNIRSAFKTIGRVLGLPLDQIPTAPQALASLLKKAMPAVAGIKPRNWTQSKSTALSGLRSIGVEIAAGRDGTQLASDWLALHEELPDRSLQIGLSRLLRFLSRQGIGAQTITEEAFAAFRKELVDGSLHSNPQGAYRQSMKLWNEAASRAPGWPQVRASVERDPRQYSFEWKEFPEAFVNEVEAFLTAKSESDPLSDDKYASPVRAATNAGRKKSLRQMASALVLSGAIDIDEVTGMAVLIPIQNVKAALRFLRERSNGQITEGHVNHAWLLRTIACHWVKDEKAAAALKTLIADLSGKVGGRASAGMKPKNRERLRQFDLPENVDLLVHLPLQVLKQVRRKKQPHNSDAVRVMRALQVAILTFVPMRRRNLTELELGRNLTDTGKGATRAVRIHLSAVSTKTYRDYEAPLTQHLFPLLDAWLGTYRPMICHGASPYLFPNPSGALRSPDALGGKLSQFLERETGLKINLHLFRHIAAKLYLDHDPSGIEIVRQLLGHTSVKTTLRAYAELNTNPAFHRLEQALSEKTSRMPKPGSDPDEK